MTTMPDSTFIESQVWMAASLCCGCLPRLPVGADIHAMSGSNQIVSEPRCFSASLQVGQFLALQPGGMGLHMMTSYHAGRT